MTNPGGQARQNGDREIVWCRHTIRGAAQQEYKTVFSPLEASRVDTRKQGAGEEHGAQNIKDSQPAQITSKGETRRNTESNPVTVLDNKSWGSNEAEWRRRRNAHKNSKAPKRRRNGCTLLMRFHAMQLPIGGR
jgi:hypothetical protein